MERGQEKEKPEAKAQGRVVMLLFASLYGFPPSLSKDAQEAAACCTSANPPHSPASQRALSWSGVKSSASLRLVLPAPHLDCFLISAVMEGYGLYPATATAGSGFGREGGVCGGGFASNNVYPWQSVFW